ncbi:hypothetical protein A2U01_0098559, partial [Trifolium medium]|nr:hypothetical protein [Trifolium medium]
GKAKTKEIAEEDNKKYDDLMAAKGKMQEITEEDKV